MINTRELRIGNLVYRLGVTFSLCVEEISKNEIVVSFLESKEICEKRPATEFEGIPLTEEWLLRFSFDNKGYIEIKNQQSFNYSNGEVLIGGFDACTNAQCFSCEIKYVHQLQNLYFALIGEELKVN